LAWCNITQHSGRNDALRYSVDINRVRMIVEITNRSIWQVKVQLIEAETFIDVVSKLVTLQLTHNALQSTKVKARMEVINETLGRPFAVMPGPVCILARHRKSRGSKRGLN